MVIFQHFFLLFFENGSHNLLSEKKIRFHSIQTSPRTENFGQIESSVSLRNIVVTATACCLVVGVTLKNF